MFSQLPFPTVQIIEIPLTFSMREDKVIGKPFLSQPGVKPNSFVLNFHRCVNTEKERMALAGPTLLTFYKSFYHK